MQYRMIPFDTDDTYMIYRYADRLIPLQYYTITVLQYYNNKKINLFDTISYRTNLEIPIRYHITYLDLKYHPILLYLFININYLKSNLIYFYI